MRKLTQFSLAKLFIVSLVVGLALPAQADQYMINADQNVPEGHSRVTVTEPSDGAANNSSFGAVKCNEDGCISYTCKDGFTGNQCGLSNREFRHYAGSVLPVCTTDAQENCVVGLSGKLGELEVEAEFIGYAGGETMPANPQSGLYESAHVSLWRLPGLIHAGRTDTYAVNWRGMQIYDQARKRFVTDEIDVAIHAYSFVEGGGFNAPVSETVVNEATGKPELIVFHPPTCIWSDTGKCGQEVQFTPGTELKLSARISNEISGWFRGRLQDPVIDIQKFSAKNNVVIISAQPVEVARFSVVANKDTSSDKATKILRRQGGNGSGLFNGAHKHLQANASQNPDSFTILSEFRDLAKDTSAGVSSLWSFSTVPVESSNRCLSDKSKVLGIVTTNATVFDGTSPAFRSGFLNYRVAGMHFAADGRTEVKGSYDLVMRSEVARCLYGFSKAPVSASISITGEGDKSIATTVIGEKNGWLKLAAYGFTFSNKTIKVKLTQKRTTITCVSLTDPKKTRKVTALGPKCPNGFRKR